MAIFPANRGGWNAAGRTRVQGADDSAMPYYTVKRLTPDGDQVTGKGKNGFKEVRVDRSGGTDFLMLTTRDGWLQDEVRAARGMGSKYNGAERVFWAQTDAVKQPLAKDYVSRKYRTGLYSLGGNGLAFMLVPLSREDVFERWGRYTVDGTLLQAPTTRRWMGIYAGGPAQPFKEVARFPCDSQLDGMAGPAALESFYRSAWSGHEFEGEFLHAEVPTPPAVVEGAYFNGKHEAAVAFNTINEAGDRVVRVIAFTAAGVVSTRDVASAERDAFRLLGFWRVGPGRLLLCSAHMYHWRHGNQFDQFDAGNLAGPMKDQVRLRDATSPMTFFSLSEDNGRTWRQLPANLMLSGTNELAAQADAQSLPISPNRLLGVDFREVNQFVPQFVDALPVARDRVLIVSVQYERKTVNYSGSGPIDYTRSYLIRGVLDLRTAVVHNLQTIYTQPELQPGGDLLDWQARGAGNAYGGMCHLPGGEVGLLTLPPERLTPNSPYEVYATLHRSADAWNFAPVGLMPGEWISTKVPQNLGSNLYAVRLNTIPPLSVYRAGGGAWEPRATNIGKWLIGPFGTYPFTDTMPSHLMRFVMLSIGAMPYDNLSRIVRPFSNPTPAQPWVSDDRIKE